MDLHFGQLGDPGTSQRLAQNVSLHLHLGSILRMLQLAPTARSKVSASGLDTIRRSLNHT
jgi:hypothetical protein